MSEASPPASHLLPNTRWDWIEKLREGAASPAAREALSLLCQGYWYPVYARLRSQGYRREQAEDFTQGFFQKLIRTQAFEKADPAKGRLRALLLTSLDRYVSSCQESERAQKRGGADSQAIPLMGDTVWAEARYLAEEIPVTEESPDAVFNRRWWALILDQALRAVAADYAARQRTAVFEALRPFLEDSRPAGKTLSETAQDLGMKEAALRVNFARLRRQLADEVRRIVESTTGSAHAATEELELFFR